MKLEQYKYKDGEVTLEFSFVEDESIAENKKRFILLLKKAIKDLELEDKK